MKRFYILLLIFTLTGCSSGTQDPAIGKVDLMKVSQWERKTNIEVSIENALNRANPQTHEKFSQVVNSTVKQSIEKEKQSLKALNIQHREVRKLVKLYEEILNLVPQMYAAFLSHHEKRATELQMRMNKLIQQTAQLEKQLAKQLL